MAINLGKAYITVEPSTRGMQPAIAKAWRAADRTAGDAGSRSGRAYTGALAKGGLSSVRSTLAKAFQAGSAEASRSGARSGAGFVRGAGAGMRQLGSTVGSSFRRAADAGTPMLRSVGSRMGGMLVTGVKGALTAGLGAAIAGAGVVMAKGWKRFTGIEDASAKMLGLTGDAALVEQSMDSALKSVKGTAFGLDEAAGTASMLTSAGVEAGTAMDESLAAIVGAAAAGGSSMSEMGAIFGKVASKGKVDGEIINQMTERQIGVQKMLADETGIAQEDIAQAVSEGRIDYETFVAAVTNGTGEVADLMGKTTTGSIKNFGAALGRLGETIITTIAGDGAIADFFGRLTDAVDSAAESVEPFIARVGELIDRIKPFTPVIGGVTVAIGAFLFITKGIPAIATAAKAGFAMMAAGIRGVGVAIAANPIGFVISLIAGLVAALVIAYQRSERFRDIVNGVWASIKSFMAPVVEWLAEKIGYIGGLFKTLFTGEHQDASGLAANHPVIRALIGIHDRIEGFIGFFRDLGGRIWAGLKAIITGDFEGGLGVSEDHPVVGALLAIHDGLEKLGGVLSDAKDRFTDFWNNNLSPKLAELRDKWDETFNNHVKPRLDEFRDNLGDARSAFGEFWDNHVGPKLGEMWNGFTDAFGGVISTALEPFKNGLTLVKDAWDGLWTNTLKPALGELPGKISGAFESGGETLQRFGEWLGEARARWDEFYTNRIKPHIDEFRENWTTLFENHVNPALETFRGHLDEARVAWTQFYDEHVGPKIELFKAKLGELKARWDELWYGSIKPIIEELKTRFVEMWETHIKPKIEEFKTKLGELKTRFEELMPQVDASESGFTLLKVALAIILIPLALVAAAIVIVVGALALLALGLIIAINKVFEFVEWVTTKIDELKSGITSRFESIKTTITTKLTEARDRAVAVVTELRDWVTERFNLLRDWVRDRFESIRSHIANKLGAARDQAVDRATQLRDRVTERWNSLRDRTRERFESIRKTISDKMGAAKDRAVEVARLMRDGMGNMFSGITGKFSGPINKVIGIINDFGRKYNDFRGKLGLTSLPEFRALGTVAAASSGGRQTASRGRPIAYADGGVHDVTRDPQIADRPILWAEAGPEAYIPLDPGKRTRSLALWQEVGRRLGATAMAWGGVSPVPGRGKQHTSGYPWARWAGDFPQPGGTPIKAWKDGIVALVRHLTTSYGKHVRVNHPDGSQTLYAHMSRIIATLGQQVKAGDILGLVGTTGNSTGDHLHFEIRGGHGVPGGIFSGVGDAAMDLIGDAFERLIPDAPSEQPGKGLWGMLPRVAGAVKDKLLEKIGFSHGALGDAAGSGVERWRSNVVAALAREGLPTTPAYVDAWLRQIRTESGGNPRAVQQVRDINSRMGDPAKGLVQVIGSTFRAYRNPALANDRLNPDASLSAGMRYAKARYGTAGMLSAIGRGRGYDAGGVLDPGITLAVNKTRKPEAILTNEQWRNMAAVAAMGQRQASAAPVIHVYIDGDPVRVVAQQVVDDAAEYAAYVS